MGGRKLTEDEWSATCDKCYAYLLLRFDEVDDWRVYDDQDGLILCRECLALPEEK